MHTRLHTPTHIYAHCGFCLLDRVGLTRTNSHFTTYSIFNTYSTY